MSDRDHNLKIAGRSVSPGVAIGPAYVYRDRLEKLEGPHEIEEHQIKEELERLDHAIETVVQDLRVSARRIEADTSARLGAIFEAHESMLKDPQVRQEIHELVKEEWMSGAHALARVFRRWERRFRAMGENSCRERADDLADLGRRVLRELAGVKTSSLEKMPAGHILVARRLLPSDTVALPRHTVAGIIVEFGGPGSHAALLAEALGIPTVTGIANLTGMIADGEVLILDGGRGEVIVRPDSALQARYTREVDAVSIRRAHLVESARRPATTLDGTAVAVLANVGNCDDVAAAASNGADGVGLYRMEQFYLGRKTPPDLSELLTELRTSFAPMQHSTITIRLLDLGGDKPVPFLHLPSEDNPFLGRRGVRLLLHYPELLETQLKALWQFSREFDARILIPMVTIAEEIAEIRNLFASAAGCADECDLPPVGAMIETPAAALTIADICAEADFLSIGTNDLTQFTMAAGRENPLVNEYYREDHPAVLRLIRIIVEEAGTLPVSICGELARRLEVIPTLLKCGIRTLSVAPPLVPAVKEAIRSVVL